MARCTSQHVRSCFSRRSSVIRQWLRRRMLSGASVSVALARNAAPRSSPSKRLRSRLSSPRLCPRSTSFTWVCGPCALVTAGPFLLTHLTGEKNHESSFGPQRTCDHLFAGHCRRLAQSQRQLPGKRHHTCTRGWQAARLPSRRCPTPTTLSNPSLMRKRCSCITTSITPPM
jgi:hypothetical protein